MTASSIKKQKIDSSFHSESLSGISNSERRVKNLYGSSLYNRVILHPSVQELYANAILEVLRDVSFLNMTKKGAEGAGKYAKANLLFI